jgi:C4-dicarboxylate-specific signal transduction histidine kinase
MAGTGRELTLLRKDNSEVPVEISIGPVGEKGLQFSVVADISERKKMRAELERAQLQILASDRMATIGRMAGGIAHEISNPIGIIHALASNLMEMVNDGGATLEDVRHEGARIVQTAERISKIVTSMRFLAREGSSDSVRIVSISKIVDTTLEFCNQRIRKESVDLIWRMPSEPVLVSCREVQIAQVLLNLLQNALDALERCQEKWIEIELETTGREVLVNVIDSGPGVPPEIASNIMEPFFTTKPVGKGTGLGLSISRAIAEEHGGKLVCGKKKGRTCFSLVLPAFTEVTAPCI